jgi:hypothetical protein
LPVRFIHARGCTRIAENALAELHEKIVLALTFLFGRKSNTDRMMTKCRDMIWIIQFSSLSDQSLVFRNVFLTLGFIRENIKLIRWTI